MFWAEHWDLLDVRRTGGWAGHQELPQDEGGHLADAGHREVTPYTVVRAWGQGLGGGDRTVTGAAGIKVMEVFVMR